MKENSLLTRTIAAATKDSRTTTDSGQVLETLPDGTRQRATKTITDERGSLFEVWNAAWKFDELPMEHVYVTTLRPGVVKGWGLHQSHEDRYLIIRGVLQVVLYDVRPESSTCGKVIKLTLSENDRRLVTIPMNVWHADHNIGSEEVFLLNMPTRIYNYADPDKFRLPIDTPLIPHVFGAAAKGW